MGKCTQTRNEYKRHPPTVDMVDVGVFFFVDAILRLSFSFRWLLLHYDYFHLFRISMLFCLVSFLCRFSVWVCVFVLFFFSFSIHSPFIFVDGLRSLFFPVLFSLTHSLSLLSLSFECICAMLLAAGGMSTNDIYEKLLLLSRIIWGLSGEFRILNKKMLNDERWIDFVHISCIQIK